MSEDYQWDRSGEASDEFAKLEELMGSLRYEEPLVARVSRPSPTKWIALAAAALVLLGLGLSRWVLQDKKAPAVAQGPCEYDDSASGAWTVHVLSGQPRCGDTPLTGAASLPVGRAIETDAESQAQIQVANIGNVVLSPSSRLALRSSSTDEHRMQLDYGSLHAKIDAPPRLFLVQTPAALAVDLGCEYTLKVTPEGETHLHVIDGYVSLESGEQAIYVPAGYSSDAFPDGDTTLPYAPNASESLLQAIRSFAREPGSEETVAAVFSASTRPQDTLGLWHLLSGPHCQAATQRLRELSQVNPDPLRLGWGACSDPERKQAWQNVLEPLWDF